jgi:hypothetical protein
MGIPRSNSPSTVSQRAVDVVAKDLHESLHEVDTERSKQQPERHIQVQKHGALHSEDDFTSIRYLKAELKALLSAKNGCTKDKEVVDAIAKLAERNPCPKGFAQLDYFPGDFSLLSAPSFPGRIKNSKDDTVQYTLGRLSFNIFQPKELLCTVRSIQNQVLPQCSASGSKSNDVDAFSYHFTVNLTIHTPDGDLEATLINRGFCKESQDRNDRMLVTFTGGTLIPGYESNRMLALWEKTFANAYETANEERSLFGWIYCYFLILFLGLTLPTDWNRLGRSRYENAFHFNMKRPPKGFFEVLYLDDDMRITKGNRGTISVLERASPSGFSQ